MSTPPGEPNRVEELFPSDDVPLINGHSEVNGDATARNNPTPRAEEGAEIEAAIVELKASPEHPVIPESAEMLQELEAFDWEAFQARYEAALVKAGEEERAILKEAESLSKYFQVWAAAASSHDNARATKRLQTRQRFVNLSEETLFQKQLHYFEVVKAFESALALLKSS